MKRILSVALVVIGILVLGGIAYGDSVPTLVVNGNTISSDAAPVIINGRVYVPVRTVAQALNCQVAWDATTQTVTITSNSGSSSNQSSGQDSGLSLEMSQDIDNLFTADKVTSPAYVNSNGTLIITMYLVNYQTLFGPGPVTYLVSTTDHQALQMAANMCQQYNVAGFNGTAEIVSSYDAGIADKVNAQ
jgi:hypothetical protein